MSDEMNAYLDDTLSKFPCGFHKGYSAKLCLLHIWKIRDFKGVFTAVLTDLSKAFDCISHELLSAKLHASGFNKISFIRKRKTK